VLDTTMHKQTQIT